MELWFKAGFFLVLGLIWGIIKTTIPLLILAGVEGVGCRDCRMEGQ